MKYFKICFIALVISCNSSSKKAPKMQGAYLMTNQTVNDGTKNTEYTDVKQLKIFTDHYVMYTQINASDSTSAFGVGSYTSDTSGVTEHIIYSSRDSSFNDSPSNYKLGITITADGYNQVISDIVIDSTKSKLTEIYQKVGTKDSSILDGVWRQTRSYEVKGTDSTRYERSEYKAFKNGYFMFGITDKDSSRIQTGIGFGTFSMLGNNKMKETDLNSTYPIIAGQSFVIDLTFDGNDNYQQTIVHPDSSKTVEFYERLKL